MKIVFEFDSKEITKSKLEQIFAAMGVGSVAEVAKAETKAATKATQQYSKEAVRAALRKTSTEKGKEAAMAALASVGVSKLDDVPEDRYADVIAALES